MGERYGRRIGLSGEVRGADRAGTPPDVFLGLADKLGFIVKGFALDITPYVERDRAELQINTFLPGVWESPSSKNGSTVFRCP